MTDAQAGFWHGVIIGVGLTCTTLSLTSLGVAGVQLMEAAATLRQIWDMMP